MIDCRLVLVGTVLKTKLCCDWITEQKVSDFDQVVPLHKLPQCPGLLVITLSELSKHLVPTTTCRLNPNSPLSFLSFLLNFLDSPRHRDNSVSGNNKTIRITLHSKGGGVKTLPKRCKKGALICYDDDSYRIPCVKVCAEFDETIIVFTCEIVRSSPPSLPPSLHIRIFYLKF